MPTLSVKVDGHEFVMPGAFEWTVDTAFLMDQASPSKFGHGAETKLDRTFAIALKPKQAFR